MKWKCSACERYKKSSDTFRIVNANLVNRAKILNMVLGVGKKVCCICYLKIHKKQSMVPYSQPILQEVAGPSNRQEGALSLPGLEVDLLCSSNLGSTSSSTGNSEEFVQPDLESLNRTLVSVGSSPVARKRLKKGSYATSKCTDVCNKIKERIFKVPQNVTEEVEADKDGEEIIRQLKEKFAKTQTNAEKYQILTSLPQRWTVRKIKYEFDISYYMAHRAKSLQIEKGIMSSPNPKIGSKFLMEEVKSLVTEFYEDDEISRVCPGKRDYEIVSTEGVKVKKQRRLVLVNLREAYQLFKDKYPDRIIGFSSFASLRPPQCVLANSSGTHCVCLCIHHQNIKLMFDVLKRNKLISDEIMSYRELLPTILCENPNEQCFLTKCKNCPMIQILREKIHLALLEKDIEDLTFKQWNQTDRCMFQTIVMQSLEFVDSFCEKIDKLLPHSYIADQQTKYFKHRKENVGENECVVICDFSENYSFVIQDAVQSFHWSNIQCTIHPFAIYLKAEGDESDFTSFIVIAESTTHNHVAVRLFIEKLLQFLKAKLPNLKRICFFSDGSGGQYKNRMNFYNLCKMNEEFGIEAEWHYFATAHGKGPSDAIGGVLKRNATLASLKRPLDRHITNAEELYDWAVSTQSKMNFTLCKQEDQEGMDLKLKNRYNNVKQIRGTQKYHSFIPVGNYCISVRHYSFSNEAVVFNIKK